MKGFWMRNRRRSVVGGLALASLVLIAGVASAQTTLPKLPIVPGGHPPVPPNRAAAGGTVADGLKYEVLSTATMDPTAISVTPDGRVVVGERLGSIKVLDPNESGGFDTIEAGHIIVAGIGCQIAVGCVDGGIEEGGLHGLQVAPDFAESKKLYVYYSVPGSMGTSGFLPDEGAFRLSTVVLRDDNTIDPQSEQVLLENPAEWLHCCHYGGDIDFMPDGTLLLSVGDDTSPRDEGWNPRDERPTREAFNAERTSQNKLDRRGKVLRLMPDGSVPDGSQAGIAPNPHVGDPNYDPYIYAMGFRSDYRIAVDQETGYTFVGNVGPDARTDDPARGPRGFDEVETIPPGGGTNHGWPRCIADNIPYIDWDYLAGTGSGPLSCEGMTPATIYYDYGVSPEFPQLASGSRTAIAGEVYRYDGSGPHALPGWIQGKLLFMEWSRDKIWTVPLIDDLDADGNPVPEFGQIDKSDTTTMFTQVAGGLKHPIDAAVGPDGALYIAEYGGFFYTNADSRITRIVPDPEAGAGAAAPVSTTSSAPGLGSSVALTALGVFLIGSVGLGRRRRIPA